MADFNHRRTTSEVVACRNPASSEVYGHKQANIDRRPSKAKGSTVPSSKAYATTNFHLRSQSYESPCSWDSYVCRAPVPAPPTGRSRYSSLLSAESEVVRPQHVQLAPSGIQRRGSESSTSSAVSNATTTAEGPSVWSATTTPRTMSPTSPNNSLLLRSTPGRLASKTTTITMALPGSPSKALNQAFLPCRSTRARACSHSAPKHTQHSRYESSVPEEEELAVIHRNSKRYGKQTSYESNVEEMIIPATGLLKETKSVANLCQRRQQHLLKRTGEAYTRKPSRPQPSPLPHVAFDHQAARAQYSGPQRSLKASRSSPQLRDAPGPPPTGPLPPLPGKPDIAELALQPLKTLTVPPTPSSSGTGAHIPHPPVAPPLPPRLSPRFLGLPESLPKCNLTTELLGSPDRQLKDQNFAWQEELQRHKRLLEQFPSESEEHNDFPRLCRSHRSLGNIRARSRSLSRAVGVTAITDHAPIAESRLSHYVSFGLNGSKTQRPSTAKSPRNAGIHTCEAPSSLLQENTPHVSVFEEDSDEEGDTVRKFVRNLFTRRIRSGEVAAGSVNTADQSRDMSGTKHPIASAKAVGENSHNDRMKNYSTSSAFSVASTLDASTVISSTSTLTQPSADGYEDCSEAMSCLDTGHSPSPRISLDHGRHHQKGPLLSRMFVRRSH